MKYSVLMSVYKKDNPDFLKLALESVYDQQSRTPDEIVVVFDGPLTEQLYAILDAFREGKEQVVFYYPQAENKGLGEALRIGSGHCTGDYIFRMDSDDISHPKRFELQSEYMESHSVSKMIGSPPGYVGFDDGGQLSEKIRRNPYSVVLFDEVEKAHPDVFNVLLQVLDDGRITDSQGRTVDFKNTILILTSNLGSQYLLDGITDDGEITEDAREGVMAQLRATFRPELLNRMDEMILFKPLTKENLRHIVDLMLGGLRKRLEDQSLKLEVTDAAKDWLIELGYDPVYGARPLRRVLQTKAETMIARRILSGDLRAGDTLILDVEDDSLICRVG